MSDSGIQLPQPFHVIRIGDPVEIVWTGDDGAEHRLPGVLEGLAEGQAAVRMANRILVSLSARWVFPVEEEQAA